MKLHIACAEWRKSAGIPQSKIYDTDRTPAVSSFETGRANNLAHFEHYYGVAISLGQKEEFEFFVNKAMGVL